MMNSCLKASKKLCNCLSPETKPKANTDIDSKEATEDAILDSTNNSNHGTPNSGIRTSVSASLTSKGTIIIVKFYIPLICFIVVLC